jgi:hypothetical protein
VVALRSTRQDRRLLIVLWVFDAVVLALGATALSVILLVWGGIGLIAAIYLTYIHVRDTRSGGGAPPPIGPGGDADSPETTTPEDAEESR